MKRKLFKSLVVFSGALCLGYGSFAAVHQVNVSDFQFTPSSMTIAVGDSVHFHWMSGNHTTTSLTIPATASSWDEVMDNTHTDFYYKATVPGTYEYKCTPHFPMMVGSFTVNSATSVSGVASAPEFKLTPNPAATELVISTDVKVLSVEAVDISGRVAAQLQPLSSGNLEYRYAVRELPQGLYMIRIRTAQAIVSEKLLIAR